MGIQNFPTALQPIIQTGYLEQAFSTALRANLTYRAIADKEPFTARVGETITKTRTGLRPVATTPLVPAANTNFDNGLTSSTPGVEQYVLGVNQYGDTQDLNVVTEKVGIVNQFVNNTQQLAEQAGRTLDVLAANALFNAYCGGNTRVRVTLGALGTTVAVDDIRGFQSTFNNGAVVAVSATYTMAVAVNGNPYTLIGATPDGTNISTAFSAGGVSGTLTFSGNVLVADGTALNAVVSGIAPSILRPYTSGVMAATTAALVAGNTMQMVNNVLAAASTLRSNGVPTIGGKYNCYLDPFGMQGLFADNDFKYLYRGAYESQEYIQGTVMDLMGIRFIPTSLAPQQTLAGKVIHRSIVVGKGALIEGDFPDEPEEDIDNPLSVIMDVDGVKHINRAPMDRLQQIIAQSWRWIGGFCVPTDTTANATVLPTATNAAYKRAIVIESL